MELLLKGRQHVFTGSAAQIDCLRTVNGLEPFKRRLAGAGLFPLESTGVTVLQVNVGSVCNLSCRHCHVDAGPGRTESMSGDTFYSCLEALARNDIPTLDITGGAPELNPHLPWAIGEAAKLGRRVIVRTNLTALGMESCRHLAELYASLKVEVVASLPHYLEGEADRQRGRGVFQSSIRVLRMLNQLGYGRDDGELKLNLAYNPGGAFLPPAQNAVEEDFRRELASRYGVVFNNLFTITNVPIGRFLGFLMTSGNLDRYMARLSGTFNASAAARVMCRSQVSIGWDGRLYDCDFNQMLGLSCAPEAPWHIDRFNMESLGNRRITVENHCYACTAGFGSSCGGAVV